MSLTILSNSLSLGYAPQLNSRVPKSLGVADPPQVELLGNTDEDSVELSTTKNISDENVQFTGKKKKGIVDRKKPTLSNFKTDKGYQSIERFERISPKTFEMSFVIN